MQQVAKIFFVLFFAKNIYADSLAYAYNSALEFDYLVKNQEYKVKIQEEKYKDSLGDLLFNLKLNSQYVINNFTYNDKDYNAGYKRLYLSFSLPVFKLSNYTNIKEQNYNLEIEKLENINTKQELALRVANAYFDLVFANISLKLAKSYNNTHSLKLEQVKANKNSSELELFQAKISLDKSNLEVNKAKKNLKSAILNIKNITGKEIKVSELKFINTTYFEKLDLQKYKEYKNNFSYKKELLQEKIADNNILEKKGEFLPELSLNSYLSNIYYNDKNYSKNKKNDFSLYFNFSIPIFTKSNLGHKLEKERLNKLLKANKLNQIKDEITILQTNTIDDFESLLEEVKINFLALENAKIYEELVQKSYTKKEQELIDVLNAQANLYKNKLEALKSVHSLIISYLKLESLIGELDKDKLIKLDKLMMF